MGMFKIPNMAPLQESSWDRQIIMFFFTAAQTVTVEILNQDKSEGLISNEVMLHFFSTVQTHQKVLPEESS